MAAPLPWCRHQKPADLLELDTARDEARATLARMTLGEDPKKREGPAATLRATLEDYLQTRKDLNPTSAEGYRGELNRFLSDWLDRPLREIAAAMVIQRHTAIQQEVEQRAAERQRRREAARPGRARRAGDPGFAGRRGAATANGTMRALRLLWNHAARRDGSLGPNPVAGLQRGWFKVPRRERLVRADDLSKFYVAIDLLENRTARDYLLLLLFTGLRRSEAAALRWDELDFAGRVIRLPAGRTKAGRKLDLPMTDFVRDLLVARPTLEPPASEQSQHQQSCQPGESRFGNTLRRGSHHDRHVCEQGRVVVMVADML